MITVAKPRSVHRDGIHFHGIRYLDPTLTAYVGEPVTVRYDPRDLGEIRVYYRNRFLCRAVSPEHSAQTVTLKDIQTARAMHRRALRSQIRERIAPVAEFLPDPVQPTQSTQPKPSPAPHRTTQLRTYREDVEYWPPNQSVTQPRSPRRRNIGASSSLSVQCASIATLVCVSEQWALERRFQRADTRTGTPLKLC